ncbi:hypothetical protein NM688_g3412 [Phlebia brevispora]|uniref:Uncharacterized protein n=1 Tax=Phlebia brevispora TaxID=194682 RepID=A0ACC1T5R8_9APHY|nr:hypothetical protein NM688_g3412 [Phlebia brevispora]
MTLWDRHDQRALTVICLRLASQMIPYVTRSDTAAEAWNELAAVFASQGPLAKVTARRKFMRYSIEEGANMEDEIRSLRTLAEEMMMLGQSLSDEEFTLTLLTALPSSWDAFVSSIGTTPTSGELIGRLIQEAGRRKDQTTPETSLAVSNAHRAAGKKNGRSKFRPGVFCHFCNKEGHIRPECRSLKKSRDNGNNRGNGGQPRYNQNNRAHITELDDDAGYAFVTELSSHQGRDDVWLGDTGTQSHIVRDRALFSSYSHTPGATIKGAGTCPALGRGTVKIFFVVDNHRVPITLNNVIHSPDMPYNLLSLGRLTTAGLSYSGERNRLRILDGDREIGVGTKSGNLYRVSVEPRTIQAHAIRTARTWYEWHCTLGHINKQQLKEMFTKGMVNGMDVDQSSNLDFTCDACIQAKHTRRPFPETSDTKYTNVGDLVYSDIWGPARTESIQHNTYYISFTDAASKHVHVDFMKSRASALDRFRKYDCRLENQTGRRIKILRVDNAKEYTQGDFKTYLDSRGIILQTTAPYSPAQNGVAERLNRTLVEHTRAMILARSLPRKFWQDAIAYLCHVKNCCSTRALDGKTPYEVFWGRRPDVQNFQEFGIPCWVLVPENRQDKLAAKSEQYIFTGIADNAAGWRYYSPKTNQILTSRNVIFTRQKEAVTPFMADSAPTVEGELPTSATPSNAGSTPPPATHNLRNTTRLDYKTLDATGIKEPKAEDQANLCFAAFNPFDEPRTVEEVRKREDWKEWKESMDKEMDQLKNMGTFELVDLPPGRKAVGSRWVFLIKRDSEGRIVKYKSRLVAQGFSQIPGQDFTETYAPVMRLESLRTLLAIAAVNDWPVHQMDVVGAYLNSELKEEVYMRQPPGYDDGTGRVYRLIKGLYGLRQAANIWNDTANEILTGKLHFVRLAADYCAYIHVQDGVVWIILIHVDDMALVASSNEAMRELKTEIARHFTVTDGGEMKTFLGLQIERDRAARTIHARRAPCAHSTRSECASRTDSR